MCFMNEGDWHADRYELTEGESDSEARCVECRCVIKPGEWRAHEYFQENDEDDWEPEDNGDEFSPGNTETHDTCRSCWSLLAAIEKHEIAEGCQPADSRPIPGFLRESLNEDPHYIVPVIRSNPELAGAIARLGITIPTGLEAQHAAHE